MIVLDSIPNEVSHHLLRVTGLIRQWTCVVEHQVQVDRSLYFPVRNQRFIIWLPLANGSNAFVLSVQCSRCRLSVQRRVLVQCHRRAAVRRVLPLLLQYADQTDTVPAPTDEDGSVAAAQERIYTGALLIQSLIADKLAEHYPRQPARTLSLSDSVQTLRLPLTGAEASRMSANQLWSAVARHLLQSAVDLTTTKVLAFVSGGGRWRGGGGLALASADCLYSWPRSPAEIVARFCDDRPVPAGCLDQSSGRGRRWAVLSTTLGAAAHELCHTMDLVHSAHGLMGRAYDDLWRYCVLADVCHPQRAISTPPLHESYVRVSSTNAHRCTVECHRRAAADQLCQPDLTFLDAASAAVLFHHAWCQPGEQRSTVSITPEHCISADSPIRVAMVFDSKAQILQHRLFSGTATQIDLRPWLKQVISAADSENLRSNQVAKPTICVEKSDLTDISSNGNLQSCADASIGFSVNQSDLRDDLYTVLVETETGDIAKREFRL